MSLLSRSCCHIVCLLVGYMNCFTSDDQTLGNTGLVVVYFKRFDLLYCMEHFESLIKGTMVSLLDYFSLFVLLVHTLPFIVLTLLQHLF